MIQLRRITQVNDPDLSRLMDLYILSFPEEERRDEKQLFRMIETVPEMSFNAVEENGELCGLSVFWDLGEFYYMEHLAVFPEMRNRKIGQQILDYWKIIFRNYRYWKLNRLSKRWLSDASVFMNEMAFR